MLTKEIFIKFINSHKNIEKQLSTIAETITGVKNSYYCESPVYVEYGKLLDCFYDTFFTDSAIELIYAWLFEDCKKVYINDDIFHSKTQIDLNTAEDLWNYLYSFKNKYFING